MLTQETWINAPLFRYHVIDARLHGRPAQFPAAQRKNPI